MFPLLLLRLNDKSIFLVRFAVPICFSFLLKWNVYPFGKNISINIISILAEQVCKHLNLHGFLANIPLVDMLLDWLGKISKCSALFQLPFHMMWILWKVRNKMIFE